MFVVDTNVAIVANGRDTHADEPCQDTCKQKIESICQGQGAIIALDDEGRILNEYCSRLKHSGAPGLGRAFLIYVFNHQYNDHRIRRFKITPSCDEHRGFKELPVNRLDQSDRKFLAVAVVSGAVVVNATDSDWSEQRTLTDSLGVTVEQLCPQHAGA